MSSKTHCDVCDGVNDAKSVVTELVRIDGPNNMRHELRLHVSFEPRYDNDEPRKDICIDCRRKAFTALAAK